MIQITIAEGDAGRKLGRYLQKILPKAPQSFFYKALRSNKIKINRKKPKDLTGVLAAGDSLELYLSEEQLTDFGYSQKENANKSRNPSANGNKIDYTRIPILYEDDQLLIMHKPVGILSQKSKPSDISLTEMARAYLKDRGMVFASTYTPSFVHRLDRNTEGVMIMAKTLGASQVLSEMIRVHSLKKYYYAIVEGIPSKWSEPEHLIHAYSKEKTMNMAQIRPFDAELIRKGWEKCELIVRLVKEDPSQRQSLLEIQLLTGKSHQIRAQLSYEGYPIVGDGKYNGKQDIFRQKLMAAAVEFKGTQGILEYMEGKRIETNPKASLLAAELLGS